jgi:hypothetical protein
VPRRRFHAAGVLAGALAGLVATSLAAAERRPFTHTLEAMTGGDGETEVTVGSAHRRATFDPVAAETFELTLGITHGVTDHLDVAVIHAFSQTTGDGSLADPGRPLRLTDVTLRGRFRPTERGHLPVDPAVSLELGSTFGASAYRAELRAVVARDLGIVTLAVNPLLAIHFGGDVDGSTVDAGWAAGATVELRPTWRGGAETWGRLALDQPDRAEAWAGPVLSWGPTPRLWMTVTAGLGVTTQTERLNVRALVGLLI